MKTSKGILFTCTLCVLLSFSTGIYSQLQIINPSTWQTFVNSKNNQKVADTFRIQTFDHPGLPEELPYTVSGKTEIFNPADEGITDASDNTALKLMFDSRFRVELPDHELHTTVHIKLIYAAWNLTTEDKIYLTSKRDEDSFNNDLLLSPPTDNYFRSFRQAKENSLSKVAALSLKNNPVNLQLDVVNASGASDGFYAIDSIFAFGNIQEYSLFKGEGSWRDAACWSHRPPLRYRHALVNGRVNIELDTQCNRLYLGNGSIEVETGKSLQAERLYISGQDASLVSSGKMQIKDKITVYRTFPERGKWYFISFPFDIYPDGFDPEFKQGDDTPNNGGSYFYLYRYNGDKRAENGSLQSNWEVIKTSTQPGTPVIEAGKGYLIALDDKATERTLGFSSLPGDIPADFGRSAKIIIPQVTEDGEEEDQGWFLCGNPFPATLPLNLIASPDALDGYAYIYSNGSYEAYPLDEDHAVPAFSAFFLKAKKGTEISITNSPSHIYSKTISNLEPLREVKTEPRSFRTSVSRALIPLLETPSINLSVNSLFIEYLSAPGIVFIWDLKGRLYGKKAVNTGSSVIPLPSFLPSGQYVVSVEAGSFRGQLLFVWNQSLLK